jgi:hypothetical protein
MVPKRAALSDLADAGQRLIDIWWVSYALIAALQLKILWNIWRYRDLTPGDTSSYFLDAARWARRLEDDIVWSPLYTAFYGTLYWITDDPYSATIAHRVIIVMLASLGVLALMRRLLPPALALLIAVWWVLLPINFNTLYEVHLFALLPILAAWLVVARWDNAVGRGTAIAILAAATILVRNELFAASVIFAAICFYREVRGDRRATGTVRSRLLAYGVPICLAGLLCGFFYARSYVQGEQIAKVAQLKHTLNMCQVYAFGYGQRHPDWQHSPWTECGALAKATFGKELPTLGEMVRNNPRAVAYHFLWNLSLVPAGLQLALFNATYGKTNPDYVPVAHKGNFLAALASLAVLGIIVLGLWRFLRTPRFWYETWFRERQGVWYAMISVAIVAAPVILVQRPRPSYLFALTCVIMALTGSALLVLARKERAWAPSGTLVACLLLLVFVPSYYASHPSPRPVYSAYRALKPAGAIVADRSKRIILGDWAYELGNYVGLGAPSLDYGILAQRRPDQTLPDFLDEQKIDGIFVQPRIYPELTTQTPGGAQFLADPAAFGWTKVSATDEAGWAFLARKR